MQAQLNEFKLFHITMHIVVSVPLSDMTLLYCRSDLQEESFARSTPISCCSQRSHEWR